MSGRNWYHYGVWMFNGRWYIAHSVDGDGRIGPFPTGAEAKIALHALQQPRPAPWPERTPDSPGRAVPTEEP